MIKTFIDPFFTESDSQELKEITKKIQKPLQDRLLAFAECSLAVNKYNELKESPLEIEETDQERKKRLDKLYKDAKTLKTRLLAIEKVIFVLKAQAESIETRAFSRYTEQTENAVILKDCLEIIQAFEPDDIKSFDPSFDKDTLSPVIKFSNALGRVVVATYCNYFVEIKDNESGFKVLKAVYDRTLDFYPQGFSDDDKKNPDCLFDKAFFKALKEIKDKQDRLNYELEVMSSYKPEKIGHIIPSSPKISDTISALNTIGSRHQMTIDEYLNSNKANDLVTFRGLDDDGLQFVFNENIADKDSVLVSFKNLEDASGGGTAPSKVFIMVLEKMNELGYFHHKVIDQAVTVSVSELLESGAYKSKSKAKDALENAKKTLSNLMVSFYQKKTGLDIDVDWFSPIGWKNKGTLLLMPNKAINWRLVGCHFAIYPPYIYRLNTHAYKLAYYVFTQARINKAPDKAGNIKFSLSLTNISRELGLPTVDQVTNFRHKQLILDKIVTAMKELTDTDREYYGKPRLILKIDADKDMAPKEIIENGNLSVTIKKGELTEVYQKIRESKVDLIESAKRKKAKQKRLEKEKPTEN